MSIVTVAAAYIYIHCSLKKKRRKKRGLWQTQMYANRPVSGGVSLLKDLRSQESSGQFHNFTRINSEDFDLLLNLIGSKIAKKNTILREVISAHERLAVTLRFCLWRRPKIEIYINIIVPKNQSVTIKIKRL